MFYFKLNLRLFYFTHNLTLLKIEFTLTLLYIKITFTLLFNSNLTLNFTLGKQVLVPNLSQCVVVVSIL